MLTGTVLIPLFSKSFDKTILLLWLMLEINVPGGTSSPITLSPTVAPSIELIPT